MKFYKFGLVIVLACLLVVGSFLGSALIGEPIGKAEAEVQQAQITVSGSGVISVAPDQAKLSLGVLTIAPNAKKAQQDNARIANNVINALIKAGVPRDKIETRDYSIWPEYSYPKPEESKPPVISAYRVSNTILVTVDDLAKIGSIIDAAVTAGANQVQSIQFLRKDTGPTQREALQKACEEARLKAEAIAAALGVEITGVVSVQEDSAISYPPIYRSLGDEGAAGAARTPIQPGELQVNASVRVVFRIQ
ncbi:MAG: uncharacterized protein PWQ99_988 [Clostridia bacterium]|nr:uncharacterized protein [Clostridia bacterium]